MEKRKNEILNKLHWRMNFGNEAVNLWIYFINWNDIDEDITAFEMFKFVAIVYNW